MEHQLELLKECPSCGHPSFRDYITCKDFSLSKEDFHLVECASCGLRFTNPRPTEDVIGPYYDSPEYVSHNDTSEGFLFTLYQAVKGHTLKGKAKLIESHSDGKTLLDYGAGTGDFAGMMHRRRWNVTAYEPDPSARKRITQKYPGIELKPLSSIADGSKAVVSLWHVLEHVHRLEETLVQFNRILETEGTLVIAVPNCDSHDARHYGQHWAAYDVPRHLYHFRPSNFEHLLKRHGFKLIAKEPMWFDSFYVSLLSEGYKRPHSGMYGKMIGWASAVIVGLISNIRAIGNADRCSSIIYILKKG